MTTEVHFEHAGTALFAVERGAGTPIVLLHGGLSNHRGVQLWAAPLAEKFRLVMPDLRGSGASHFAGELTWDLFADDVAALLAHLGIPRAIIGGVSFGGGVAIRMALRHPGLVAGLVLLHPAFGGAELGMSVAQQAAMNAMDALGRRAPAEGISVLYPLADTLPASLRERARASFAAYDPASVAASTRFMASAAQPFARNSELAAVTAPALVVPGVDATHPVEVAEVYRAHLPNSELRAVDTSIFAPALAEFATTHWRETPATRSR